MINEIILQGRLTKEPKLSTKLKGEKEIQWCSFSLAVDRDFKGKDGRREADFFYCRVFGPTAKYLTDYAHKGGRITVKGRMESGYYNNQDGTSVYFAQVAVDKLWIIDYRDNDAGGGAPGYDMDKDGNHFSDVPDEAEVPFLQ